MCDAFLVEAKWFAHGEFPKSEEYLRNGIVSSGVHVVLVHMFFLLGQGINKETVDFVDGFPPIITLTAMILRLWDDLGTAKVKLYITFIFLIPGDCFFVNLFLLLVCKNLHGNLNSNAIN